MGRSPLGHGPSLIEVSRRSHEVNVRGKESESTIREYLLIEHFNDYKSFLRDNIIGPVLDKCTPN
ncbi:hypothetical protein AVEN_119878-1, partial [Araneus ventricosus]